VLEFDDATERFGPLAALDECTFAARPGRLTGFLGPNGAGKATAMRAVFGLVELDSGWCGGRARASRLLIGRGSATCQRSGGCTRGCACGISSSTWSRGVPGRGKDESPPGRDRRP
jgi:energy-coupling factor transporter ATP-binding protein EcfA2